MTDNILFLLLASIGLTLILKWGFIFNGPREWLKSKSLWLKELLSCSQCMGFWSGFFIGLASCLSQFNFSLFAGLSCFLLGFASSFLSQVADLMLGLMDEKLYSMSKKNSSKKLLNE